MFDPEASPEAAGGVAVTGGRCEIAKKKGRPGGGGPHQVGLFQRGDVVGHFEFRGHAIECRINAEDPDTFVPSPGRIPAFRVPGGPGIRVDTAVYADAVVPPYYDSLVAKLVAHGRDRSEAIARMHGALDGFVVEGIKTTIPLHKRILAEPDFIAGKFDTHFLDHLTGVKEK